MAVPIGKINEKCNKMLNKLPGEFDTGKYFDNNYTFLNNY